MSEKIKICPCPEGADIDIIDGVVRATDYPNGVEAEGYLAVRVSDIALARSDFPSNSIYLRTHGSWVQLDFERSVSGFDGEAGDGGHTMFQFFELLENAMRGRTQ